MHDHLHFVDATSVEPKLLSEVAVTRVICEGSSVGGVASLGDDVFVVRQHSQQIEVYDAVNFAQKRHLTVPELGSRPFSLAVCSSNDCLYAPNYDKNCVHRVELSGSNAVITWTVASKPGGLTVNRARNLLVVSQGECKLQLFTTRGTLLQNIPLQPDGCPVHAISLASGQFVVSNGIPLHCICLVDDKGAVIRSYRGEEGSQMMKISHPPGVAVDKRGNILVANQLSRSLLVLDRSLTSVHEMSVSVDGGLKGPFSLWYDKSRGRLYIGEWQGGRVIVVHPLKDFSASPD